MRRYVEKTAAALGADPESIADLILAVNEAVTNIILHGYDGREGQIEVEVTRQGRELAVHLRDDASPFDPTAAPEPALDLPLEQRRPGGVGVMMMRQLCDDLQYCPTPQGGNQLTLIKEI